MYKSNHNQQSQPTETRLPQSNVQRNSSHVHDVTVDMYTQYICRANLSGSMNQNVLDCTEHAGTCKARHNLLNFASCVCVVPAHSRS